VNLSRLLLSALATPLIAFAADCDLSAYKAQPGLRATTIANGVEFEWQGAAGSTARARFQIVNGQPLIHELAIRKQGGQWLVLGRDLTPEYQVTTAKRRISEQQLAPLRKLGRMDPAYLEEQKWNAFWDAPLSIPGVKGTNSDLPRKPEEIRRDAATYQITGCKVATDGARLEVTFPGVSLGLFSGGLKMTVYRGTALLRQEVIAKTGAPSVAYKYNGGARGFRTTTNPRMSWQDTSRSWQKYEFGGAENRDAVALRARNRIAMVESPQGALAIFPPPHKFFFAREIEINLGYLYYRKDGAGTYAAGIRQAEHEDAYRPYGVSDEVWNKRVNQSRHFAENFALYNAPPGTLQHMPVYYLLSPENAHATHAAALAFTHDDNYKPLPGYQVAISHFHTHFHEMLADAGTIDIQPPWLTTFRAMGINIAMMSDFHSDGHGSDPGPIRFKEQQTYFDGCRRHSDKDFLIIPGEEPDAQFGGHYTMILPRPVFWSKVKKGAQQFEEQDPTYGKVYHVGSEAEELQMLTREGGLMWQAHPRTKGSSGYPDAVKDKPHFASDRFLGGSYQSLPVDQSEKRICEKRCFDLLDDMNNWAGPKYLFAEGDTYQKFPDDDTYSQLQVNYVRLAKVPSFDEGWASVLKPIRAGDYFVTSGEILIPKFTIEGTGAKRTLVADVEWTFPLEFVEVVWGDGNTTGRNIVSQTDKPPFGKQQFRIPFDAAGKKWVRLAVWDSAGNGGFVQPVHLK